MENKVLMADIAEIAKQLKKAERCRCAGFVATAA